MGNYLGNDEIKEIKPTDLKTPLGAKVSEVFFFSALDLLHRDIDAAEERKMDLERKLIALPEDNEIDRAELTGFVAKAEEDILALSAKQSLDLQTERSVLVSARTLKENQSKEPAGEKYYHDRKIAVSGAILKLMAEYNLQDIEIGGILQNIEQSYRENVLKAVGDTFGKKHSDLNMLDYHYASNRKD